MLTDLLTVAVLGYVGSRLVAGARVALRGEARRHIALIVRGVRPRHILLAPVVLLVLYAVLSVLWLVPPLRWGWWTAIGGQGNPVVGVGPKGSTPGPLETIIPVVFVTMLLIGLPLLVEGEEWVFRRGAEHRDRAANARRSVLFGLVHALIGIPIGVAMALSVGGFYFTWAYLRAWRATGSEDEALFESTRSHLSYNLLIAGIVILALATGST